MKLLRKSEIAITVCFLTHSQSIDDVQSMLSNPVFNKDRHIDLISNYSKTITQDEQIVVSCFY